MHRLLHGPATFPRILYEPLDRREIGVLFEGPCGQLVEPRAHHAPVVPQVGDVAQIELEVLRGMQDLVAFRIGLQHPVLDAVVHHLHIVNGTGRPDVRVAFARRIESRKFELPPSITMSPRVRWGTSCSIVLSTACPDGTITQATRRPVSCLQTSARSRAPFAPSCTCAWIASELRS